MLITTNKTMENDLNDLNDLKDLKDFKNSNLIFLVGLMGCGKTTIGQLLAEKLHYEFVDTDDLIVQNYQQDINTIFHEKGEKFFRNLETTTLQNVINNTKNIKNIKNIKNNGKKYVISTGGGIVLKDENRQLLKQFGYNIYLQTDTNILVQRLMTDTQRPLLKNKENLTENLQNLYNQRNKFYLEVANLVIQTNNKNIDEIILNICRQKPL